MEDTHAFLTTALSLLVLASAAAGATAPPASGGMDFVFDIARSQTQDIVYFRSEDVVQGQLLDDKVDLATPYGTLSLPLRRCAGLAFEASRPLADAVVTVNFNRVTGIVTDHVFRFRVGSSGAEVPLRKETIAFIVLKKTPGETAFAPAQDRPDLFVMTNGDLLTGRAVEQNVDLRTDYAKVPVAFREIREVHFLGDRDATAVVTRAEGDPVRGAWETGELSLKLEVGPDLPAVYKDQFARIFVGRARELAPAQFGVRSPVPGDIDPALLAGMVSTAEPTLTLDLGNQASLKLALIPAGKFLMGSPGDEAGRDEDEGPQREVVISRPFYLGVHEVTQGQYEAVMGANPSKFVDAAKPVERVSWDDAVEFCRRAARRTRQVVTLPTEAQWEYACRSGLKTRFGFGDDDRQLSAYARYSQGAQGGTAIVGARKPNAWGLYDMHGNVWEWCADWYASSYINAATTDPAGPLSGETRVLRGGSWANTADGCRCATRNKSTPEVRYDGIGFRVVVNVR